MKKLFENVGENQFKLVKESLTNLEQLHNGISTSTLIGKAWYDTISNLETVVDEVKDFKSMYSPALHGPTPNALMAMQKLQQIIQLLTDTKPVILGMDDIQKKDRI